MTHLRNNWLVYLLGIALVAMFAIFVYPVPQIAENRAEAAEARAIEEASAVVAAEAPYYGFEPCESERDGRGLTNERYEEDERCCDYEESQQPEALSAGEEGQDAFSADDGDQRSEGPQGPEDRVEHVIMLDDVFDADGAEAWLEAAGMPYDWVSDYFDARQPQGETLTLEDGNVKVVVSGMQVDVRGLRVNYPACFTTDQPDRALTDESTRQHTPDPENGSTLYTNATTAGNGEVTVWVDCSNWGQLDPTQ